MSMLLCEGEEIPVALYALLQKDKHIHTPKGIIYMDAWDRWISAEVNAKSGIPTEHSARSAIAMVGFAEYKMRHEEMARRLRAIRELA